MSTFLVSNWTSLCYQCLRLGWIGEYNWLCEPLNDSDDPKTYEIAYSVWLYFILKIFDLLDTVFMVLKKNFRQITFLHVYHHAGMVFAIWLGVKIYPGGHHTLLGFFNCIVHCTLYGYYFYSLCDSRVKNAWWKRHITTVQLIQFALNVVHELVSMLMPSCQVDKRVSALLAIQNCFMFFLFAEFYVKTYCGKKNKPTDKDT